MNEIIIYKNEILRKIIHLTALLIPLIYHFFLDKSEFIILINILLLITFIIDYMRRGNNKIQKLFNFYFYKIIRDREKANMLNASTLLIGFSFISIFFNKSIVIPAILIALMSDAFAAIFGLIYGKTKLLFNRTIEGSLMFNITTFILLVIFVDNTSFILLVISIIITLVELSTPSHLDNFTIPVASSILLYII